MGMKEWIQRTQPTALHVILVLSVLHFIAQMVICHLTHALTLLLDSCHMLCNIIALIGCIFTVKFHSKPSTTPTDNPAEVTPKANPTDKPDESDTQTTQEQIKTLKRTSDEKKLKNTFGWARIEVLTMLVVCVFFASLCLSVVLEAAQTLIHISHLDAMHNPVVVFIMGAIGLALNGFCYLLIGGYTFHQGSFIQVTSSGCVVLEDVVTADAVKQGQRRLSRSKRPVMIQKTRQRQGFLEALRDVLSCFLVMVCAIIVYLVDPSIAKFIDPAIAILSSFLLLSLTYPYMKESGMILLQTIPGAMDIDLLKQELLKSFPSIVNVHDFHVWQLNNSNIVSTVHIIFPSTTDYVNHCDGIKNFFLEEGITQVTIQPEFSLAENSMLCSREQSLTCLMTCVRKGCIDKHCCGIQDISTENLSVVVVKNNEEMDEKVSDKEVNTTTENEKSTEKNNYSITNETEKNEVST